uniref:Non-canonical E2 ubiquitin-conjugating enzyme C-terminal domain-containing protein n=1 Tax=Percolomonas cosmopolitus TaxID=63605 RepID=A0A7S1PI57_9EUKA|mmetsp:Transcript_9944/g.37081  ORF Transcript_9944/g.37081 Transcript_9944/m.37081 type:complete len:472 (+) Transcript_9944:38-1453(+)|eukprot:CAMPEP_0117437874 /NCGR_PEP_ID=MMETSP0759-20121206/1757_1 /TAXON_ID=63605 /ORGANISM="Percolomonas cosmopolitus, Strain WS" /LENGTH=471 /DNA_ID=CAMNT_0005229537 /DNA_START=19 /DNA_END=1434 /DNA_ORIENTATION=+
MEIQDIPLRLTALERIYLSVITSSLTTSQYTSKVDIRTYQKQGIIQQQQREFINLSVGLLYAAVASGAASLDAADKSSADYHAFAALRRKLGTTFQEQNVAHYLPILADMIEVARRYKIMNPHKMRVEYGKLVHILMDAKIYKLYEYGFKPIQTVGTLLGEHPQMTDILSDEQLVDITSVDYQDKDVGYAKFIAKYVRKAKDGANQRANTLSHVVERVLHSISDAQSYIHQCVEPIQHILGILRDEFQNEERGCSLTIRSGSGGSTLSHDHNTQYKFVYQTMLLWESVMEKMYTLSLASEQDLFLKDASRYSLVDTGQGLNRIQPAHHVGRHMSSILNEVRSKAGRWVGLSVVHLGDRDVPNALVFIDKYRQIPGIVNPVLLTVGRIPKVYEENEGIRQFIDSSFGSPEKLRKEILRDYFRHGFDGSGSNGGSCIDGRLTSSWNWGSKIAKKSHFPIFLLCGFQSFDGEWS